MKKYSTKKMTVFTALINVLLIFIFSVLTSCDTSVGNTTKVSTAVSSGSNSSYSYGNTTGDLNVQTKNIYYVSVSGSDSNNGKSISTPWKSLTYAAAQLIAGDKLYVKAGTYNETTVIFSNSGTSDNWIAIEGYQNTPGDNPSFTFTPGSGVDTSVIPLIQGSGSGNLLNIDGRNYISIKNIGITGSTYGFVSSGSSYIKAENVYIYDIGLTVSGLGLQFYNTNYFNIKNVVAEDAGMVNLYFNLCKNGTVEGCLSYAVEYSSDATDYHIVVSDSQNITVNNCSAYNLHPDQTTVHPGHGIGIKDTYKGSTYINSHSTGILISNSNAYDVGEYFFVAHEAYGNKFENCTAPGNYESEYYWSEGINIRDGAHDNIFSKCIISGTRTALTFQDTSEGPSTIQYTYNNQVKNSIFKNNSKGIELWSAKNNSIKNNVFDNSGSSAFLRYPFSDAGSSNILSNSIVVNVTGSYLYDPYSVNDMSVIYSDFYGNSFSMPSGTGNISSSPLFADSATGDYHLKSTVGRYLSSSSAWVTDTSSSLCINAGNPSDDYSNEPSPNGSRINIGAYGNTGEASK